MAIFGVAGGDFRQVLGETTEIFVAGVHSESIAKVVMDLSRFAMTFGHDCPSITHYDSYGNFRRALATIFRLFLGLFVGALELICNNNNNNNNKFIHCSVNIIYMGITIMNYSINYGPSI